MSEYTRIVHTFQPVYDKNSRIMILGSLPSVKSREQGFYYGHPRNRFWSVILPSTSPANAAWSTERLTERWSAMILPVLKAGDNESL